MKEQLIEKLKAEILHIFESGANEIRVLNMVEAFINKYYEYEALTSVKSESEEKKRNPYAKTPEEIAQWIIDNRYPKSEQEKVSDSVMYHTIVKDLHDFANNSEAMKWVSAEDRLPNVKENGEKVLLYRKTTDSQKALAITIYDTNMVKYCEVGTLWTNLPTPPNQ